MKGGLKVEKGDSIGQGKEYIYEGMIGIELKVKNDINQWIIGVLINFEK
jgi:hypothetical protein